MQKKFIDKIKSRGYWRINFQPLVDKEKLTLAECNELIEKNNVSLRGWNYPHYPGRRGDDTDVESHDNFYQGWVDWENHKEFWRMYQSGQFLHYLALREDWLEEDSWSDDLRKKIKPMEKLGVTGSTIYQITEIFEFLARLAQAGVYDEGIKVNIELFNTKDRELWIEHQMRAGFLRPYKTSSNSIIFSKKYTKESILSSPRELAFEAICYIFDRFGWHNPSPDMIQKDQDEILTGKF